MAVAEKKKSKITASKPASKRPSATTKPASKPPATTKPPSKAVSKKQPTKVSSTKPLNAQPGVGQLTPSRLASRQKHREEREKVRQEAKGCTYDEYGKYKEKCHKAGADCLVYQTCGKFGVDAANWPIHPFENLRDNPEKERQLAIDIGKISLQNPELNPSGKSDPEALGRDIMREGRKCVTQTMWNDPTFQASMRENKDPRCRDDYARWYERQQARAVGGGKKRKLVVKKKKVVKRAC